MHVLHRMIAIAVDKMIAELNGKTNEISIEFMSFERDQCTASLLFQVQMKIERTGKLLHL